MLSASRSRLIVRALVAALILGLVPFAAPALGSEATGTVYEVYPGDDFRSIHNTMQPGDQLVFHEGEYRISEYRALYGYNSFFYLERPGTPDKPIVLRGYGNGEKRPVFIYDSPGANLMEVRADNIVIDYMEFQAVAGSARAVRIVAPAGTTRRNVTVQNSVFRDSVVDSISANLANGIYDNIVIRNNAFYGVKYNPIYIGEQNGTTPVTNLIIENNYIDGSQIGDSDSVGYGIQLKLNVTGAVVRNNLIVNTKGPGIMVYGASSGNPADANLIEGNVIANSRTHAGIVVGGGPSVVRHNIVSGNQLSGIYVYDYNTRGLMHQIVVENNTAAVNIGSDIYVVSPSTYQPQHVTIRNNYTFSSPGVPGIVLPADLTGWTVTGNVQGATNTALTNAAQRFVNVIPYNLDKLDKVWELLGSLQGPFSLNETKTVFARLHGFLHRAS